ncbi:uncharacterized protein BKA55DRAFT_685397 [Fusarium redolens]|uniref:Uncharacterized protein n=1 Tax=Fusarium redolens TaxID=48865 RepID=A0A9P9KKC1_FUSRE|nr:uncharacterized protein BKA55DRAFT_685397 [Fusarium redolens]KAH7264913.1 hypothetical protein BKA55DRAFT_685397 [Fusarium redolens]
MSIARTATIREAAKSDRSMSNNEKRQIAEEFNAARRDLQAASQVAMATAAQSTSMYPRSL